MTTDPIRQYSSTALETSETVESMRIEGPHLYWNDVPLKLYEGENWLVIQNGSDDDDTVDHREGTTDDRRTVQLFTLREMLKNGNRQKLCPATMDTFLCLEVSIVNHREKEKTTTTTNRTTIKNMLLPSSSDNENTNDDDDEGYLAYVQQQSTAETIANHANHHSMVFLERRAPSKQLHDGDRILIRSCEDPTDLSLNIEYRNVTRPSDQFPNSNRYDLETNTSSTNSSNNDVDDEHNDDAPAEFSQLTEGTSSSSYSYIDAVLETQQHQQQRQLQNNSQSMTLDLLTQPDGISLPEDGATTDTVIQAARGKQIDDVSMARNENTGSEEVQNQSREQDCKEPMDHPRVKDDNKMDDVDDDTGDDSTVDPSEQKLPTQPSSATTTLSNMGHAPQHSVLSKSMENPCITVKEKDVCENVPLDVTKIMPTTPNHHDSAGVAKSPAFKDLTSPDLLNDSIDDVDDEEEDLNTEKQMKHNIRNLDFPDDEVANNRSPTIQKPTSHPRNGEKLEPTETNEVDTRKNLRMSAVPEITLHIQEENNRHHKSNNNYIVAHIDTHQNELPAEAEKMENVEKFSDSKETDRANSFAGSPNDAIITTECAENELGAQATESVSVSKKSDPKNFATDFVLAVSSMTSEVAHQTICRQKDENSMKILPREQPTGQDATQSKANRSNEKNSNITGELTDRTRMAAKVDDGEIALNAQPVELIFNAENDTQNELQSVATVDKRETESPSTTQLQKKKLKRKASSKEIDCTAKKGRFTPQSVRHRDIQNRSLSMNGESVKDSTSKKTLRSANKKYNKDVEDMKEQEDDPIRILVTGFDLDNKQKMMVDAIGGSLIHDIKYAHTATHVIACDGKSKIRRTPKLMIAMSVTPNIVTMDWLCRSAKTKSPLPCEKFLIRDKDFEKHYNFSMEKAYNRIFSHVKNDTRLLEGWSVFVCPGVAGNKAPPTIELKLIVEAARGSWLTKLAPNPKVSYDKTLIITSDPPTSKQENAKYVENAVKEGARKRTTTWLFRATMTQELDM